MSCHTTAYLCRYIMPRQLVSMMSPQEFHRLLGFTKAAKNAFRPTRRVTSRRSAKHPSVGKVYKNSRVVPQVHLETIFNHPAWK